MTDPRRSSAGAQVPARAVRSLAPILLPVILFSHGQSQGQSQSLHAEGPLANHWRHGVSP